MAGRLAFAALVVGAMLLWLHALGRPLLCPCGTVALWHGGDRPHGDSQQFADWYSLLHGSFGVGLFLLLARTAPEWTWDRRALAALVSSAIWEAVENTPAVIALFNPPETEHPYRGDSMLNALGDTAFVLLGFGVAARLPRRGAFLALLAAEVAVGLAIGDGLVLGTLRLLGAR